MIQTPEILICGATQTVQLTVYDAGDRPQAWVLQQSTLQFSGALQVALQLETFGKPTAVATTLDASTRAQLSEHVFPAPTYLSAASDRVHLPHTQYHTSASGLLLETQVPGHLSREAQLQFEESVFSLLERVVPRVVAVIDSGDGLVTELWLSRLLPYCRAAGIFVLVSAPSFAMGSYRGANLLVADFNTARRQLLQAGNLHLGIFLPENESDMLESVCEQVHKMVAADAVLVPRGAQECGWTSWEDAKRTTRTIPAPAVGELHPQSHGVCAARLAGVLTGILENMSADSAIEFSNACAAYAGTQPGAASFSRTAVGDAVLQATYKQKILGWEELSKFAQCCQNTSKSLNLVCGIFDDITSTQLELLRQAKQPGEVLLVAMCTDSAADCVARGIRPKISQTTRLQQLAMQPMVDGVVLYDGDTEKLVRLLKPAVYSYSELPKYDGRNVADYVVSYGGVLRPVSVNI